MDKQEQKSGTEELRLATERLAEVFAQGSRPVVAAVPAIELRPAMESVTAALIPALNGTKPQASASEGGWTGSMSTAAQGVETSLKQLGGPLGWLSTLNPILGLMKLFGGSDRPAEIALPKYERPPREHYLGSIRASSDWAARAVDYGSGWQVREMERGGAPATQQITVNVQAMDSRSFLDRREDIAAAVRQALLETHSLSDVFGER